MRPLGMVLRFALALSLLAFASACNEDGSFFPTIPETGTGGGGGGTVTPIPTTDYLSGTEISSTAGTYVSDEAHPTGTGEQPFILGTSQFIRGASMIMEVTVEDTQTELFVSVANANVGYYHFDLSALPTIEEYDGPAVPMGSGYQEKLVASGHAPGQLARAAATTYVLEIQPVDDPSVRGFTVQVSSGDGTDVSAARRHIVAANTTAAASDRLQVSLNWSHPLDLDLHVQVPSGETIFFGSREGPNGGILDLDSNPACNLDNINNENITWPNVDPPAGEYVVSLDLWSACEVTETIPYIVTVIVNGEPQTFSGSFQPEDVSAPNREITRVTVQ